MRRSDIRICCSLALAFLGLASRVARAQPDPVATARQLAISGIDLVEQGDCARGAALLERAQKLHPAVVHLQYLARCHVRAGRLVAATELWRKILLEPVPAQATPAVYGAIAEARAELAKTLPRLARTTIHPTSVYAGLKVKLDQRPLPPELLDAAQVLDPGPHRLVATAPGYATLSREWVLEEGGLSTIALTLHQMPTEPASPDAESRTGDTGPFPWATVGWVGAATGAAAIVGGVVTLLARNNRRDSLLHQCPDDVCNPNTISQDELDSQKDTVTTLTTASTILLIGGGTLLVAGGGLVLLDNPKEETAHRSGVRIGISGPGFRAIAHF